MSARSVRFLILLGVLLPLLGCCPTLYVPKFCFERYAVKLTPADPVFVGPGGAGPIFSLPTVQSGSCCGNGSGGCCPPGTPLQPIDPFGWLRFGNQGTHEIDPVGWVFGI